MNVLLSTFDPIGALLFDVTAGLIASVIFSLWVLISGIRAEIRGRRERKGR